MPEAGLCPGAGQGEGGAAVGGQEEAEAGVVRQVLDAGVTLPQVGLERKGQLAVGLRDVGCVGGGANRADEAAQAGGRGRALACRADGRGERRAARGRAAGRRSARREGGRVTSPRQGQGPATG